MAIRVKRGATPDDGKTDWEYRQAVSHLQEARQLRNDLILHAATLVKIYGQSVYEDVCTANRAKIEALEEQVLVIDAVIRAPNLSRLTPLLKTVHELGFQAFWDAATVIEKRTMISTILARIVIVEPTERYIEEAIVEPQAWLAEYITLPERVSIARRTKWE